MILFFGDSKSKVFAVETSVKLSAENLEKISWALNSPIINKDIIEECIKMVREKVGPVAAFKIAIIVKRLPKTRSGKVLRGTVRKIADNEPYKMPATIDDLAILDEIKTDLIENKILKL